MKISLNTTARVTLTSSGAEQYNRIYYDTANLPPVHKATKGRVVTCELWRLMSDFGSEIGLGLPDLFEDNYIEIFEE